MEIWENLSTVSPKSRILNVRNQCVRYSTDNWNSQTDLDCTLVDDGISDDVRESYCLFETFSFRLALPTTSRKLEFLIGYRHEGDEDWDDN